MLVSVGVVYSRVRGEHEGSHDYFPKCYSTASHDTAVHRTEHIPGFEWCLEGACCPLMVIRAESVRIVIDRFRSAHRAVSQGGEAGASNQILNDVTAATVMEPVDGAHGGR